MHDNINSISFDVNREDRDKIIEIVDRVCALAQTHGKPLDYALIFMDIVACHLNGCPLDLARLAVADDFNLLHDVCGIGNNINHRTGRLENCFLPRYAARLN